MVTNNPKKSKMAKVSGEDGPKKEKNFLTVALGASAGGIKALSEFFEAMPADSGMAFVVILHLSQTHKSSLAEILQRKTKMEVQQVSKTVKVKPNNVYVIPPAKHLVMTDGVIKLKAPNKAKGVRVPIDKFFRTLAEAYGAKAVCIILSGTGSDGSIGMGYVKENGGFAMIQDPNEAEYDGMPRSAIDTKIADVVMPIADMPEKLLFVRDTTQKWSLADDREAVVSSKIKNMDSLRDVLTLLRVRTGHDFSNYKRSTVIRRVARHLQIHETDDLKVYLKILREKPEEVTSLLNNLLINVTNFFRDKAAFDALEQEVIPALFHGKTARDQIRVWVAGCSTGEEVYSLSILLSEFAATLPDPPKIQLFASDVDDEVITAAREGRFTEAAITEIPPQRLEKFFVKEASEGYRISKKIREMVLFASHNILRDPPFSRLDMVSCRNVMIYLNRETQEQVLKIFHFALSAKGYLFLGTSETADNTPKHFSTIDKKNRIYQVSPSSGNWRVPPALPLPGVWKPALPNQQAEIRENMQSYGELHHRLIEYYAPPSLLINEEGDIIHLSKSVGQYLRFAEGEPSSNIMDAIHPALLSDFRAALFTARKEKKTIEATNIRLRINEVEKRVNIIVRPVGTPEVEALILFEENTGLPREEPVQAIMAGDEAMETVLRRMDEELRQTKERLRNTVEQYETSTEELKASNEELQAVNEELRSTAEELETSKEELQSLNEELTTVNNELKERVDEVGNTNSDLENLMRSTHIATIFLDRDLKIKRYTPQTTDIFNVIKSDIGRPLSHITHRLSPDHFQDDAAKVLSSLQPIEREVHADLGNFYLARFAPYRTIDDRIDGVVITFVDVTEQKKASQEIDEERAYAEGIVATLRSPLIILNKNFHVVSASRSFYTTFKTTAEETEGKYISEIGNGQWNIPRLLELLETILPEKGEFTDFEVEHTFRDIGHRTMLLDAREIERLHDSERLILLAIEDITIWNKLEKDRIQTEKKYSTIVKQSIAGILKIDLSGKIIFANTKFCEILGYNEEELLQKNFSELIYEDDFALYSKKIKALRKNSVGYAIEKRMVRKDGSIIWTSNFNSPILNDTDGLEAVSIISIDISQQKVLERQKDEFIGVASHELKTPLTSIKGYTELLMEADTEGGKSESTPLIEKLNTQVNRLNKLVYDLLDTTRIAEGKFSLHYSTFDLNAFIKERTSEIQITTPNHKLSVKTGKIAKVYADIERIGLVLSNLITNAAKFSPEANLVVITTVDTKKGVKVTVRDFGMGLATKEREKVFERFYRVESSGSGFGLGLSISRDIINLHGGTIGVENADKGSLFYFTIPYKPGKK